MKLKNHPLRHALLAAALAGLLSTSHAQAPLSAEQMQRSLCAACERE